MNQGNPLSLQSTVTQQQERRKTLFDLRGQIVDHFGLCVGFSLFWTWVWLVFQTQFFSPSFLSMQVAILPAWVIPLSACAAAFFVMGMLVKFKKFTPRGKTYMRLVPSAMSLGIGMSGLLTFSPLTNPLLNGVLLCAGGLIAGAGTACLHVEWGRLMGNLGQRQTILYGVIATLGAAVFLIVITSLPPGALWICAVIIPPISMNLLQREAKIIPRLYQPHPDTKLNIPWKFLVTAFIQGLSFGIVQAILLLGDYSEPAVLLSACSFVIAAVALLFCALFFKMDFNQLIYQIGFLVMSFGYLLFALVGSGFFGALLVHSTGYRVVDIMMWALCAYLIKQRGLPTNWVFAWTTGSLLLGQACGALVGNTTVVLSLFSGSSAVNLAVVMMFILLASSLLMSDRKNLKTGWGMVRPGDSEALPSNFSMGCKLVSRQFSLTAREEEIFVLLAKGLTRPSISEQLTLSKETVKTHIRNIYRKMDIHSQQEIIFAVEEQQRSFGFDGEV